MDESKRYEDSLLTKIKGGIEELFVIWAKMGLAGDYIKDMMEDVEAQIMTSLEMMLSGERKNTLDMLNKIAQKSKEVFSLSKELGKSANNKRIEELLEEYPYLEVEKMVNDELKILRREKEERMRDVLEAIKKNEEICRKMSIEPMPISKKAIPTLDQFNLLKQHNRDMEIEYNRRMGKFLEMKSEILDLLDKLELEPNNTFEREVCCFPEEDFLLSAKNLSQVEEFLVHLQQKLETDIKYADTLRERIENLTRKLELENCHQFLMENSGFSKSVIEQLETKLNELEVLKLQHLEEFILKIREELKEWWNKCHYGQAERNQFSPYKTNVFNEKVLEDHETELERIKHYYNENATLFGMVNEVQTLWAKRLELERLSKDPSRLGNWKILQQEEKDRKRVNTGLPKIEARLFQAIDRYEAENGKPFLVGGVPFKDYWGDEVEKHEIALQMEKQQKNNLKKQINIHETMYGSMPANATKTSNKATKRPAEDNTPLRSSKVQRFERSQTTSALSAPRTNTLPRSTTARYGLHKATPNTAQKQRIALSERNDTIITGNTRRGTSDLDSIDSKGFCEGLHKEAISSTFRFDSEASKNLDPLNGNTLKMPPYFEPKVSRLRTPVKTLKVQHQRQNMTLFSKLKNPKNWKSTGSPKIMH